MNKKLLIEAPSSLVRESADRTRDEVREMVTLLALTKLGPYKMPVVKLREAFLKVNTTLLSVVLPRNVMPHVVDSAVLKALNAKFDTDPVAISST